MSTLKQRIDQYLGGSTSKLFGDRAEVISDDSRHLKEKIDQRPAKENLVKSKSNHTTSG